MFYWMWHVQWHTVYITSADVPFLRSKNVFDFRNNVSNNNYGSVPAVDISSPSSVISPRRVIYCVHGKPSAGCCKVLEGEVIDISHEEDRISRHTRESITATDLGM